MNDPRELIIDALRRRILRGVQAGALGAGDRLPSARELAGEFRVDYRLVIAAYKEIAAEGLVELRPRGGVYVAPRSAAEGGVPPLPERWLAGVLADGLAREIPGPELHEWLRRSMETLRLRAFVVTTTADQVEGLCRELRDDFGFDADGIPAEELRAAASPPLGIRRADLVVTTAAQDALARTSAAELRKPVIVVDVNADLVVGEWALLLRRPVYAVVATVEFGEILQRFFAKVPGAANLRVLVLGRDDLAAIPADAPTYVTHQVRRELAAGGGGSAVTIRGRILPAARTISAESAREIFAFVVRANVEALSRRGR